MFTYRIDTGSFKYTSHLVASYAKRRKRRRRRRRSGREIKLLQDMHLVFLEPRGGVNGYLDAE